MKRFYNHLIFLGLTTLIVCMYGYYFGTFDQASHIPFLKKTIDPTLYPNDHFFDLSKGHFSYFWLLFIPFYKAGVLEISMFVVHILATYLTLWALWRLSQTLFKNTLTSLLVVVASVLPHFGFSAIPLFEFSMLNRTATLPFELIALNYYLKKNYVLCCAILGVLYNFHVLSVNFIIAMIAVDAVLSYKTKLLSVCKAVPFFIVGAFPVLFWKLSHSGVDAKANWEWFTILSKSHFYHLFNFVSFYNPIVTLLTISTLSAIVIFFITNTRHREEKHVTIKNFMYGGMIVLLLQLIATYIFPSTIIIQSQVIRISIFMSLFTYIYFSHYVSKMYEKSKYKFFYLLSLLLFSIFPVIALIGLLFVKQITTIKRAMIGSILILATFAMVVYGIFVNGFARPEIHIWPEQSPFYKAQLWAKNNTAKNAVFIIPPAKWWLYDVEWRVGSERSTVSTLSELLEAAFDPGYIPYWKPRFEAIAPGALAQFKGNLQENMRIANDAYYTNTTEQFKKMGKKYNASYLVVEKKYKHPLPIVYQNEEYIIYSLTNQGRE